MAQESGETKFSFRRDNRNYSVEFFGGPLDGGEITTDERPNNDHFVHRFAKREYVYKYHCLEPTRFRAEYAGLSVFESAGQQKASSWYTIYLALLVPTLLTFGVIAWYFLST
jgi:hypothetical protein